jgi:hypothetical protein
VPAAPASAVAVIAPHAGYLYSGVTAAHVFSYVVGIPLGGLIAWALLYKIGRASCRERV